MTELDKKIVAAIARGQHVTTRTIGGMRCAKFHEPTDEARQAAIDEFDAFVAKVKGSPQVGEKEGDA